MKRLFYIAWLVFAYCLLTAKSCDDRPQSDEARDQDLIAATRDSIRSSFGSDILSANALRAFESDARIKLSDFSDYMAILTDTSMAAPFRDKAREMVRGLFVSETSVFGVTQLGRQEKKEVQVRELLQPSSAGPFPIKKIESGSVMIGQSLVRTSDSVYAGKLAFSFVPANQKPAKNQPPEAGNGTIGFCVIKHKKIFGKETLVVWDLFLGNRE
jgi:hypothetical protein